jgi:hypothetical protein
MKKKKKILIDWHISYNEIHFTIDVLTHLEKK